YLLTRDSHARQLSEIIQGAYQCHMVTGKDSEEVETLRAAALPLALRSLYGDGFDTGRWDSIKFSVYTRCFLKLFLISISVNQVDEILEFIKSTWGMLGLD
ncbi:hypothetical protein Tco_1189363, partial [Tanacetum coccineum]